MINMYNKLGIGILSSVLIIVVIAVVFSTNSSQTGSNESVSLEKPLVILDTTPIQDKIISDIKSPPDVVVLEESKRDVYTKVAIPKIDKSGFKKAPELIGISGYINTTPEKLEKEMEDKVILYDIWTYSCINCKRTLPYVTSWNEKYSDQGLLIIGIHSPEFEFEKDINNVQKAVIQHDITYPVVQDNDFETWKAFENKYWPHKFIADHEGYLRYDRIGEGGYDKTEKIIQALLLERANSLEIHLLN